VGVCDLCLFSKEGDETHCLCTQGYLEKVYFWPLNIGFQLLCFSHKCGFWYKMEVLHKVYGVTLLYIVLTSLTLWTYSECCCCCWFFFLGGGGVYVPTDFTLKVNSFLQTLSQTDSNTYTQCLWHSLHSSTAVGLCAWLQCADGVRITYCSPRSDPRLVCMEFLMDRVTLEQIFLQVVWFSLIIMILPVLHSFMYR
jgi:hypothetical protein